MFIEGKYEKIAEEAIRERMDELNSDADEILEEIKQIEAMKREPGGKVVSAREGELRERMSEKRVRANDLWVVLNGNDHLVDDYEFEVLLNGPDEIPERISEELWAMPPELRKSVLRRASDVGDPVKWGWLMDPFEDLCKTSYPEQIRALEGEVDGVKFSLPETPWDLIVDEVKLGIDDRAKESISMMMEEKLQKDAAFIVATADGEVVNYVHAAFWGKGQAWAEDFENGEHERYIPEDEVKGAIRAWAKKHDRKLEWR